MKHRWIHGTALGVPAVAAAVLALPGSASADPGAPTAPGGTYTLAAQAVALDSTFTFSSVPFGIPLSNGSYGASAALDSLGASRSDAGAPYAPLLFTLPQTGNGAAQSLFKASLPVVPRLPGYVSAQFPLDENDEQNAGGYVLTAEARERKAIGQVSIGGQSAMASQNNVFATASSLIGDDGVARVVGAAGASALSLKGIFDLANVSSALQVQQRPGAAPEVSGTNNFGTITFAGLTSGITGNKVTFLGSSSQPLSTNSVDSLNAALKPAGVHLAFLPQKLTYTDGSTSTGSTVAKGKTLQGVDSGALQISMTGDVPSQGPTTETITVGQVHVITTNTALAQAFPASPPIGGADQPGVAAPAGPAAMSGAATSPIGSAAAPANPSGVNDQPAPTRTLASPDTVAPVAVVRRADTTGTGGERLYLVLALAAASALGGAQVIRFLAVRLTAAR